MQTNVTKGGGHYTPYSKGTYSTSVSSLSHVVSAYSAVTLGSSFYLRKLHT